MGRFLNAGGRVEIDDAYLGGELPGGKGGRGSENKVPFIAAVQTTEAGHPLRVCLTKLEFQSCFCDYRLRPVLVFTVGSALVICLHESYETDIIVRILTLAVTYFHTIKTFLISKLCIVSLSL